MGKWTSLKKQYPKAPLDGDYQLKVEAIKTELFNLGDVLLKDKYVELRHYKEKLKEGLSQVNAEIEACEQVFVDRFESRGELNQKFEDGLTLYLTDSPNFRVADEGTFYGWLRS